MLKKKIKNWSKGLEVAYEKMHDTWFYAFGKYKNHLKHFSVWNSLNSIENRRATWMRAGKGCEWTILSPWILQKWIFIKQARKTISSFWNRSCYLPEKYLPLSILSFTVQPFLMDLKMKDKKKSIFSSRDWSSSLLKVSFLFPFVKSLLTRECHKHFKMYA